MFGIRCLCVLALVLGGSEAGFGEFSLGNVIALGVNLTQT